MLLDWTYATCVENMDKKAREEFDEALDTVLYRKEKDNEAKDARRRIAELNQR